MVVMVVAAVMMRETPIYNRCLFNAARYPLSFFLFLSLLIPKVSGDTLRHTYLGILIVIDLRARNRTIDPPSSSSSSFLLLVLSFVVCACVRLGSVEDCVRLLSTSADFHFLFLLRHHYQRLFSCSSPLFYFSCS